MLTLTFKAYTDELCSISIEVKAEQSDPTHWELFTSTLDLTPAIENIETYTELLNSVHSHAQAFIQNNFSKHFSLQSVIVEYDKTIIRKTVDNNAQSKILKIKPNPVSIDYKEMTTGSG